MSFASFPIDTLPLHASQLTACARAGLATADQILLAPPTELAKRLRPTVVGAQGANDLINDVARAIVPESHTLNSLVGTEPSKWVGTGDAEMDALLGGGLRVGCITELVGESAAGKSNLTLTFAVAAQMPAFTRDPGGAVILTSERELSTGRLIELVRSLSARADPEGGQPLVVSNMLDNIHTSRCADVDALEHALTFVLPPMLAARRVDTQSPVLGLRGEHAEIESRTSRRVGGSKPIRLLVLDSITALLRGEHATTTSANLAQRSRHLCSISDRLKALALEFSLAVVVVNQVSDVFRPLAPGSLSSSQGTTFSDELKPHPIAPLPPMLYGTQARWFSGQSSSVAKEASLGIVWANAVNVRVMLSRTGRRRLVSIQNIIAHKRPRRDTESDIEGQDNGDGNRLNILGYEVDDTKASLVRRMHLVFSPFAPTATLDYVISASGVHALSGSYRVLTLDEALKRRDENVLLARAERGDVSAIDSVVSAREEGNDFGDEVFDDFGDLPTAFWEEIDVLDTEPMAIGVVD